ncbi:hypothetical protein KEM54_002954, partial [Ascosphaera aggregata]
GLGLSLLLDLLISGTTAGPNATPTIVPSPAHLALASTIVVHPTVTTCARSIDDSKAADVALELLHATRRLVGPLNARFADAFTITHFLSSRHSGRLYGGESESVSTTATRQRDMLNIAMARNESVWSRAEDFWQAVGWAFKCSVLYPPRWDRWRLWLEFMCDVLEDDWNARVERRDDDDGGGRPQYGTPSWESLLKESLIVKYIASTSALSDKKRRIMRAIFADGQAESTLLFKEVFRDELKIPRKCSPRTRDAELDLEENIYGDYDTQDEDDDDKQEDRWLSSSDASRMQPRRAMRTRRGTMSANALLSLPDSVRDGALPQAPIEQISRLGPLSSIRLRQRLLQLLSNVSNCLPMDFIDVDELYHLFVEAVHHLPFPTFHLFISTPDSDGLLDVSRMALCERILCNSLENGGFSEIYTSQDDEEGVSQEKLQECYLPFSARTRNKPLNQGGRNFSGSSVAVDNAKVSVVLETMLRLLAEKEMLEPSRALTRAVEKGITVRLEKVRSETRRNSSTKQRAFENMGSVWLTESSERLRLMVEMLRDAQ